MGSCCVIQGAQPGALDNLDDWERGMSGRGHVYT